LQKKGGNMLPIFNDFIKFLKDISNNDKNLEILKEGYYWFAEYD
jgi:hypothetical protein